MTHSLHLFLILASLLSFDATAQWAWTDKEGRQVFSDRAPSVDVPDKSVFKRPGQNASSKSQDVSASGGASEAAVKTAAPDQSSTSRPQAAGVDKDLAERMKIAAQAQTMQRKAEEDRISKIKADNCERARLAQKTLDSGVRLSQINEQGQKVVMDQAARAAEAKRVQSIVDSECN